MEQLAKKMKRRKWLTLAAMAVFTLAGAAGFAQAQTYSVVYDFAGTVPSPFFAQGALAQGQDGNIYGTSAYGGASGSQGTVYKMTPSGTITVLYSFPFNDDCAGLTLGADGNFYGGCHEGQHGTYNFGFLYKITPSGTLTVLHNFTESGGDGSGPNGAPILGTDGNFYGTTIKGGTNNLGTVYKMTAAGTVSTLYSFTSQASVNLPDSSLVQGSDGSLYGTTSAGYGAVYKITTAGTLTVLHTFAGSPSDGATPAGVIEASGGNFYGTTETGGANNQGTVFEMTAAGSVTLLHSFSAGADYGYYPAVGLVEATDGNFYGAATSCSSGFCFNDGSIFEITSAGTFAVLHQFGGSDGANPSSPLLAQTNGLLYGVTSHGGTNNNCLFSSCGVFYSLSNSLSPFVSLVTTAGHAGSVIGILGQGFNNNSVVKFGGVQATAIMVSGSTFINATVPAGALTGYVTVTTGGATLTSIQKFTVTGSTLSLGLHFDFDGYGTGTDYTVWRPSNGNWYVLPTNGGTSITKPWGENGDIVVPGDYDGDLITDYAIWRPSTGTWYVLYSSTNKTVSQPWGLSGDIPVPGDYDGDGKTDYAVWRPSTGTYYVILSSTGKSVTQVWGESGDVPTPADYDGDGKTDYAVWRPSTGTWYVLYSSTNKTVSKQWGLNGDIPVPGDYDGDGKTDYAVWRPSNGTYYVILSSTGKSVTQPWGENGDMPVARDYDGDNKTDYAVWRPSTGTWYVLQSSNGKTAATQWGLSTDIPVNKPTGQ